MEAENFKIQNSNFRLRWRHGATSQGKFKDRSSGHGMGKSGKRESGKTETGSFNREIREDAKGD